MIDVTSGSNYKEVQKAMEKNLRQSSGALVSAINRAAITAEKTMRANATGAPSMYRIKSGDVKKSIKISKAKKGNIVAVVKVRGRTRPLYDFTVSPKQRVNFTGRALKPSRYRAAVLKGKGLKPLDKQKNKPFVTSTRAGIMGVFSRKDKSNPGNLIEKNVRIIKKSKDKVRVYKYKVKKEKLEMHFGPSIPQMIDNTRIMFRVKKDTNKTLESRLEHELNRIIRRNQP